MPSVQIGNQSGGQALFSGNPFSGTLRPFGGVQLMWDPLASGLYAYVGLSGGLTVKSGVINSSFINSGGGLDGLPMAAGTTYFIPKIACQPVSGSTPIFVACDQGASGLYRLYYEVF